MTLADSLSHNAKPQATPKKPVRVCYIIDWLIAGGTELQVLHLIRNTDRTLIQPFMCLLKSSTEGSRELEPADCPVLRLNVRSLRRPSTLAAAWRFARFLRQNKIEVVHCFFPDSTRFAVPVARMAGVRRVLASRRNLGHWMNAFDRLVARLYRRWIDLTVANCEACRQAVVEQEGIAPDRVVVIPNGIDLERFAWIPPYGKGDRHLLPNGAKGGKGDRHLLPERPEGGHRLAELVGAQMGTVPFSARRVGMVANLRPVKAPDVFVRAAALVAQSHPNAVFQIAGTGDAEPVRRLARECGIEDRLELLGQVEDIPSFLAGLDVAVLSSDSEGLSNALLEYMAAGRAIVATDVGGARELIDDGRTGFLVPPQSPESMARRISQLLADPKLQNTIGENARQKAEAVFSVQRIKHEYCKIYDILAHA